jgi:UDP-N-acetylmuramyl pentapeptide phosphotransferase/UDP-N-acetylglucosamine-1-phosphate transferase
MKAVPYGAVPACAFVISWALLVLLLRRPHWIVDVPNERSMHEQPVPRTGGLAIVVAALGTSAILLPAGRTLMASALAMALVSLLDDWRNLPALPRLATHALVAAVFASLGLGALSVPEAAFIVLVLTWMANLYNFMDGSDGLAGGMAVIGFGCYALGAWLGHHAVLGWLSAALAAAALPFLFYNFHPARIFMGDVGAVTLGFMAGAIGALGWREGTWPPLFPLFVFSPFIADASLTLLRRVLRRQKFWQPHREHYYQKLARMGMGHRNTALAYYALMMVAAVAALASLSLGAVGQLVAIIAWSAVLLLLARLVDRAWFARTPSE